MPPTIGYYSIIQFCPDAARREVANVGVVLLCPEIGFLQTRMAEDIHRIREVFPRLKQDRRRLRSTLHSIAARLEVDREQFLTVEALRRFAETRANAMRLTPPLSTRVEDSEDELNRLFDRLVGAREKRKKRTRIEANLAAAFASAEVSHLVRGKVTLELPHLHRPIEAPFGFQNGRFNVIQPTRFIDQSATGILSLAGRFEIEGDLLFASPHPRLGPLQLVVVAQFGQDQADVRRFVRGRLEQSHARLVPLESLDDLIQEIRATARPVDATLFDS
jgi:hypothetical protein